MFLICSFIIGRIYISVYGIAIEAIMQCFILDESLNVHGDPLDNCPEPLKKFM